MNDLILEVKDLVKHFQTPRGLLKAVDGVSFSVGRGKTLGVVGESGCGKSTTGRAILRLLEPNSGTVSFDGVEVTRLGSESLRRIRRDMQIIFQDPYSSLDPRKTVGEIIAEPLRINGLVRGRSLLTDRVVELMATSGLAERLYYAYPHELDGGRRQRIGIARALAMNPKFIVCDEPVSALDVSIQAQILNLMKSLQRDLGLTYVFITHDLAVVNHFSDEIAVMYLGRVVERAPSEELFRRQYHPYTKALLSAISVPSVKRRKDRMVLKGEISSPIGLGPGCRFAPRCPDAIDACLAVEPPLVEESPGHFAACLLGIGRTRE